MIYHRPDPQGKVVVCERGGVHDGPCRGQLHVWQPGEGVMCRCVGDTPGALIEGDPACPFHRGWRR